MLDTLANTLEELEDEVLGDGLGELQAEPLVNTVADKVLDIEAETLGARLSDVRAKVVVAVLGETLADMERQTLHYTPGNMEANGQVHPLAAMLHTWRHIWQCSRHSTGRHPS